MAILLALGNMGNFIAFVYFLSRPKPPWQHLFAFAVGGYVGFRFAYRAIVEATLAAQPDLAPDALIMPLVVCIVGYVMLGGTLAVIAASTLRVPKIEQAQEEAWTLTRSRRASF